MKAEQNNILNLLDLERYEDALAMINDLPLDLQRGGRILMAKGDSHYELGNDLEALQSYADYINLHPDERDIGFALFGAAMCLKNLELQAEAEEVLLRIDPTHVGIEKELEHSLRMLEKQKKAKHIFLDIKMPEGKRKTCSNS